MKAERRHELRTNALATKLVTLPDFGKKYGRRAVTAALIAILAGVLSYRYFSSASALSHEIDARLADARDMADRVRDFPAANSIKPGEAVQARPMLAWILDQSKDPKVRAQALVIQGDLDWNLAQAPVIEGAQFGPDERPDYSAPELTKMAKDSYQEVLDKYSDQAFWAASARFGLAAIAENDAQYQPGPDKWAAARADYQAIVKMQAIPDEIRSLAEARIEMLDQVAHEPIFGMPLVDLAPSTAPTTASSAATGPSPTTVPALASPSAAPLTRPAAAPAASPATRPSTSPA